MRGRIIKAHASADEPLGQNKGMLQALQRPVAVGSVYLPSAQTAVTVKHSDQFP